MNLPPPPFTIIMTKYFCVTAETQQIVNRNIKLEIAELMLILEGGGVITYFL